MSKRFGRNQKRKLQQEIAQLKSSLLIEQERAVMAKSKLFEPPVVYKVGYVNISTDRPYGGFYSVPPTVEVLEFKRLVVKPTLDKTVMMIGVCDGSGVMYVDTNKLKHTPDYMLEHAAFEIAKQFLSEYKKVNQNATSFP